MKIGVLFLLALALLAQQPPPPPAPPATPPAAAAAAPADGSAEYVLGPGDQVQVRALDLDEIGDKPVAVDGRGFIRLPLVGRVQAAGLTTSQLERSLAEALKAYVRDPEVTVAVSDYRSQPVSVLGAVASPGVQQLQGRKSLFEVLSLAGGLRPDAGHSLKITRRKEWGPIPLPNAVPDSTGQFSVAEVSVKSVMEAKNPQENILICPNDVISVPKADMIYVIGAVKHAGGFVLNEKETITVLQAMSLAEGLDKAASPKKAKILRPIPGQPNRMEIAVDLRKVLSGQANDVPMNAEDILFIPTSGPKKAAARAAEAAIQITTGLVIWSR